MVEVIGRTAGEKALEKKAKDLYPIASEMFSKSSVGIFGGSSIGIGSGEIIAHVDKNLIQVNEERYFDDAFKLAQAYEEKTGDKWRLKKNYD